MSVLIVEDDDDSREMLAQLAELYGCSATGAATADEALECAGTQLPGVALVDIGLAGADGYEVASRMRRIPGAESVYLVALTGYSDAQARQRAEEAGFDEFVVKPLSPEKLKALLSQRGS